MTKQAKIRVIPNLGAMNRPISPPKRPPVAELPPLLKARVLQMSCRCGIGMVDGSEMCIGGLVGAAARGGSQASRVVVSTVCRLLFYYIITVID